jgi:hypothetical protein
MHLFWPVANARLMKPLLSRRDFLKASALAAGAGLAVQLSEKPPTEHAATLRIVGAV